MQQLTKYEKRLEKGIGPLTSTWEDVNEETDIFENEELLLRNTHLNAQVGPFVDYSCAKTSRPGKLKWIDSYDKTALSTIIGVSEPPVVKNFTPIIKTNSRNPKKLLKAYKSEPTKPNTVRNDKKLIRKISLKELPRKVEKNNTTIEVAENNKAKRKSTPRKATSNLRSSKSKKLIDLDEEQSIMTEAPVNDRSFSDVPQIKKVVAKKVNSNIRPSSAFMRREPRNKGKEVKKIVKPQVKEVTKINSERSLLSRGNRRKQYSMDMSQQTNKDKIARLYRSGPIKNNKRTMEDSKIVEEGTKKRTNKPRFIEIKPVSTTKRAKLNTTREDLKNTPEEIHFKTKYVEDEELEEDRIYLKTENRLEEYSSAKEIEDLSNSYNQPIEDSKVFKRNTTIPRAKAKSTLNPCKDNSSEIMKKGKVKKVANHINKSSSNGDLRVKIVEEPMVVLCQRTPAQKKAIELQKKNRVEERSKIKLMKTAASLKNIPKMRPMWKN